MAVTAGIRRGAHALDLYILLILKSLSFKYHSMK
jgi:hypothetical protein